MARPRSLGGGYRSGISLLFERCLPRSTANCYPLATRQRQSVYLVVHGHCWSLLGNISALFPFPSPRSLQGASGLLLMIGWDLWQSFPWLSVGKIQPENGCLSTAELSCKFRHFDQFYIKHFDWIKTICTFIRGIFGYRYHAEISCSNIELCSFLSAYVVSLSAFCFIKFQAKRISWRSKNMILFKYHSNLKMYHAIES